MVKVGGPVLFLVLSLLVLALAAPALADQLVVVEAHGIRLAPGATVDASKPFSLQDGQSVTLLTAGGHIVHIDGPSSAAPGSLAPAEKSGPGALAALVTERNARTSEVGVVRSGEAIKLPNPWVVDVTHPGTSCVQPDKPVVLWRSGDLSATPVAFTPKDRSWNVAGMWPASEAQLIMPANMPLRDQTEYVIELGERTAPVTVRLIPQSVNNDAMRVGFMTEVGCGNQVNALITQAQR